MRQKRLLIVSDYFYPHWTGIAKVMSYMLGLIGKDYDCTILTVQHEKQLKKHEHILSANVIREKYLFSLSRAKYSVALLYRFALLAKKTDAILLNSPSAHIIPLAILSKLFGKKLIILHHGDLILPQGFFNRILEKIFDLSSFIAFSLADTVATFTDDYARNSRVLKYHLKKCTTFVIPPPERSFISDKTIAKKLQKIRDEKNILFGFAGRFVEEKGFDILFAAIPQIVASLPTAHFVFAGEVAISYEKFYEKTKAQRAAVQDHVTFLGLLTDSQMQTFYHSVDFVILPSRSDCFPLVQVEAVLAKTPVITADIPGARAVATKTGFGILFTKENPQALAKACISAYRDRDRLLKNYQNVIQFFDKNKHAAHIRATIEK